MRNVNQSAGTSSFPSLCSVRNRVLLALFSLFLCLPPVGLNADARQAQAVSILADPAVAELGWVADFSYIPRTTIAQRKKVITYTMVMIEDHVQSLLRRKLPWVTPTASADENFILGRSYGWPGAPRIDPLPLFGYQITDPKAKGDKLKIILASGNHPREDPSNWAFHGLIEFLVSEDPRAQTLREKIIFYVYPSINPDGRQYILSPAHAKLMPTNSNPQLKAAGGESNHNRVWETNGKFTDIDAFKAAFRKDTGGRADYMFDFHGIPQTTFMFTDQKCLLTPLGQALLGRGFNFRDSGRKKNDDAGAMTLRRWSMSTEGVTDTTFTPEIASGALSKMLLEGQKFALAMHDMLTGKQRPFPHLAKADLPPRKPAAPASAWLLDGNARSALKDAASGKETQAVEWSPDTPFQYPGNQSIVLGKDNSFVDFGPAKDLDGRKELTVSLWVKGDNRNSEYRYLISRYNAKDKQDQRAWAFMQVTDLSEVLAYVSADGSDDGSKIKRYLSAQWPLVTIFDGTWRHLAFTYKGGPKNGVLKLYVDGRELQRAHGMHIFSDGVVRELFASAASVRLGATKGGKDSFLGQIDEVAIWPLALSPGEIRWLGENSLNTLLSK